MAEYIERKAAYALSKRICDAIRNREYHSATFGHLILDWIDALPTADVQPVRHGRWIPHMESIETTVITASRVYEKGDSVQYGFTCSECGRWEENREPFCNCGAKMDKEMKPDGV